MAEGNGGRQRPRSVAGLLALIACQAWLTAWPVSAGEDRWSFDPEHTRVRIIWDHLGVSRQSARVEKLYGSLVFSPTEPTSGRVEVTLIAKSLSSGVPVLDRALQSADFFDVERHPHITFRSTVVTARTDKTGAVTGELTVRGITKSVRLDVVWNFTGEHPLASFNPVYSGTWVSGFSARAVVKRSEFGMTLAAPLVSDEVAVEIEAEFLKKIGVTSDTGAGTRKPDVEHSQQE